jgi:hypothetical protein
MISDSSVKRKHMLDEEDGCGGGRILLNQTKRSEDKQEATINDGFQCTKQCIGWAGLDFNYLRLNQRPGCSCVLISGLLNAIYIILGMWQLKIIISLN